MLKIDSVAHSCKLKNYPSTEKVIFFIISIIFATASKNSFLLVTILAINIILTLYKAYVSPKIYFKLLSIPLVFLTMGILPLILSFNNYLPSIDPAGINIALQIGLSSFAALTAMYFLALSTPFTDLAAVLTKIHLPKVFIEIMLLIYRFIFVLMETAYDITVSQRSRLGYEGFKNSYRSFALLATNLLLSAHRRANEAFTAMLARNYDGNIRVLTNETKVTTKGLLYLSAYFVVLLTIAISGGQ